MKASFSAVAALSLLPLLASVTNALPNPAVSAGISAVKSRTPSSVGIAFTYIEPEGNLKHSRGLNSTDTPSDKTSDNVGNGGGEFTISATEGAYCVQLYANTGLNANAGESSTQCCRMSSPCCNFHVDFPINSAAAATWGTPSDGVYLWPKANCQTDSSVRWIPNAGTDTFGEPKYQSMSLPKFFKK